MSPRALLTLGGVGVVLLLVLLVTRMGDTPPPGVGDPLISGLRTDIDTLSTVRITTAGDEVVATLELRNDSWVVAERDDWPADLTRMRTLLLALVEARRIEERTADPDRYARLGVEALDDPAAAGVGVAIEHPGDSVELIIGDTGVGGDYSHVRRLDETAAWLVSGTLSVARNTGDWLAPMLLDVPATRVGRITILHPDGQELRIRRAGPDGRFELLDLPGGRELLYAGIVDPLGAALANLTLTDVAPLERVFAADIEPVRTIIETRDGLVISLLGIEHDDEHWIAIDAAIDESAVQQALLEEVLAHGAADAAEGPPTPASDAARVPADRLAAEVAAREQEVAQLQARLAQRAFRIPRHRYMQLTRRVDDLLEPANAD
ncbi:MAG: DUF4340 domain-containing protein [Gammaproteobacteria bacterium]|nr:DUF4340 domain-containing protein [Gammaproteobacteria bacterium]